MENTNLLEEVRQMKQDYDIGPSFRTNDKDRKRLTVLITHSLMELPVKELEGLTGIWIDSVATTGKPLTDIERYSLIARVLEPVIFNRLKNEKLRCDPLERETDYSLLNLWENDLGFKINMGFIEEIIDILKGGRDGKNNIAGCDVRSRNNEVIRGREGRFSEVEK